MCKNELNPCSYRIKFVCFIGLYYAPIGYVNMELSDLINRLCGYRAAESYVTTDDELKNQMILKFDSLTTDRAALNGFTLRVQSLESGIISLSNTFLKYCICACISADKKYTEYRHIPTLKLL